MALFVSRKAKAMDFPIDPERFLTAKRTQVSGLGKSSVQKILEYHGITRVLAEEGGRTSRGSVENMTEYVNFLNDWRSDPSFDLDDIESWWIEKIRIYFSSKPFVLRYDPSLSTRSIIHDLLDQAESRQSGLQGSTCPGTVLQHLVGAKLDIILPGELEHHGASVADEPSGRDGDFIIGDVAIHVTTAPTEALLRKCRRNLEKGQRPVIITTGSGRPLADGLARQEGIAERVDVFEAEQFLSGNLYELGKFRKEGRKATAADIVTKYNEIVRTCETEPGLEIELSE
ncbi:MAG: DUF4928 family protein [Synergistota bacterium]|nr:DUF4928 family protein [Synergistota bacterium]